MTEWERLLKNGSITEDFLQEEIVCEYRVAPQLKKLWAIELDLLQEFKKICEKHNLTYFAYAGTLLGAVRHGGFIPWDDDLDVCMPRKDYEILTKECVEEFKAPYFLQTPYTDENYAYSFAKLRNINTCFASKAFIENPMNQGAFLDIFPLEFADEHFLGRRQRITEILGKCSAYMSRNNKFIKNKHTELAGQMRFSADDNISFYEEVQSVAKSSDEMCTKWVSVEVSTLYAAERKRWPKEYFCGTLEIPFCNTTIRAPKDYEKVLSVMYKDYMQFPPVEQRGLHHSNTVIDVDAPFDLVRARVLQELEEENDLQR